MICSQRERKEQLMPDNRIYSSTDKYGVTTSSDVYGNQWVSTTNRYGETVTTQTREGYNPYAGTSSQMPYAGGLSSAPRDRGREKTQNYFTDIISKKYKIVLWILFVLLLLVLPRKPLLLFIVFAGMMLYQHFASLEKGLIGGFFGFCGYGIVLAFNIIWFLFGDEMGDEVSFTHFTAFASLALMLLRLVVCLIRAAEYRRFNITFEADIEDGMYFNEKTFSELKESGAKSYSEYIEQRKQKKKEADQKKEDEKAADVKKNESILPGTWRCDMRYFSLQQFGPDLTLREDKTGTIDLLDGTRQDIQWRYEYPRRLIITTDEGGYEYSFEIQKGTYKVNGKQLTYYVLYYKDSENSSSPQLWGAWSSNLSRIDLIYTDEFKEYQRPARKDGVNQASFAVKKSKYTDHTKLSVTGKMIYGYFEKYEQVSLQLFDKGISYASGFINEIRVRDKNGNERLVNRLDEGQEATLVFDNISLPYGKENPYWIYGKEYGKIVNYSYEKTVEERRERPAASSYSNSSHSSGNYTYSPGAATPDMKFTVEEINFNDNRQLLFTGHLNTGTVQVNDRIIALKKFGDRLEGRVEGIIKPVKEGKKWVDSEVTSVSAPLGRSITLVIEGIPVQSRNNITQIVGK